MHVHTHVRRRVRVRVCVCASSCARACLKSAREVRSIGECFSRVWRFPGSRASFGSIAANEIEIELVINVVASVVDQDCHALVADNYHIPCKGNAAAHYQSTRGTLHHRARGDGSDKVGP